jgi:uncharacterized protein YjiS (DUF1127 family)
MAFLTTTHKTTIADRFAHRLASVKTAFVQYRLYRQTLSELHALSARELDDIGLTRGMITRVALDTAYGK